MADYTAEFYQTLGNDVTHWINWDPADWFKYGRSRRNKIATVDIYSDRINVSYRQNKSGLFLIRWKLFRQKREKMMSRAIKLDSQLKSIKSDAKKSLNRPNLPKQEK